jgi:dTDP-4-dehydrorhamnose reductase
MMIGTREQDLIQEPVELKVYHYTSTKECSVHECICLRLGWVLMQPVIDDLDFNYRPEEAKKLIRV